MGELNAVIYPLNRFKICAVLSGEGAVAGKVRREMRFSALRDAVGITDTTLSKQLGTLQEHGYVERFREYGATRAKDTVWVMLTEEGKRAFDSHVEALREITGEAR